jgi:hypothetical protein
MRIFVSYTMRDGVLTLAQLRSLEVAISQAGVPYIDVLHNRSSDRQRFVQHMLSSADALLACITGGFFQSPWVRFEIAMGLKRNIPIVFLDLRSQEDFVSSLESRKC